MNVLENIKEERTIKNKENILQGNNDNLKANIIRIIKGSLLSIIVSVIFLIVFAMLLTYTSLSENTITPIVLAIVGLSILLGSYLSTKKINKKGILNGAMVGVIYMLILYIISSVIFMDFSINASSIIMIVCGIIAGIIGGIVGVNTNKK